MDLQTFTSGNRTIKITTHLALIYCAIITTAFIIAYYMQIRAIENLSDKILVIDTKGQVYNTSSINSADGRIYEYKNHVKMFFSLWYAFDEGNYPEHTEAALHLIGNRGKELLNEYNDALVLTKLKENNLRYEIQISDIIIDMNTTPISGRIEGIQTGRRKKGQISRTMCIKFTLDDVSRSDDNIHGCKIITWDMYESHIIKEENDYEQ